MEHLGNVLEIRGSEAPVVDCIIGGSPCQNLSVAGNRKGLAGEESSLFVEQIRIIKEMRDNDIRDGRADELVRPRYGVWENVPGALSSNGGEDFRIVLEEFCKIKDSEISIPRPEKGKWNTSGLIVGDGFSVAWRVMDAQFWGVPQRRRRISLVADFNGQTAGDILFPVGREPLGSTEYNPRHTPQRYFGDGCRSSLSSLSESLSGNPEQSGEARQGTAGTPQGGTDADYKPFVAVDREGKQGGGQRTLNQ